MMNNRDKRRSGGWHWVVAGVCCALVQGGSLAEEPVVSQQGVGAAEAALTSLSLDQLVDVRVVTASKRPERQMDVPAAVYVITQEDIRRSGATTIADVLRLAPGVQVAQVTTDSWTIAIRGLGTEFSNKLLVLVDGRTVYTPLWSGVLWSEQEFAMEDIDRVEVIRGPGASVWGANAVNGVINIITRRADQTQGGLASVTAGSHETASATVRYGDRLGEDVYYRVWAKAFQRDASVEAAPSELFAPTDQWLGVFGGFRMDGTLTDRDTFMLSGQLFHQEVDGQRAQVLYARPYVTIDDALLSTEGGHVLGSWTHEFDKGGTTEVRAYYDHVNRDSADLQHWIDTVDVDAVHNMALGERQHLAWGLGYRHDKVSMNDTYAVIVSDEERTEDIFSSFAQYNVYVVPDRIMFVAGSKLEHFDSVGWEVEPTARLLITPNPDHTVWAAVSRAVRTPSVFDGIGLRVQRIDPPGSGHPTLPTLTYRDSRGPVESEEVIAYEAGYKLRPTRDVWLDIAGFYDDYDNLKNFLQLPPEEWDEPAPHNARNFISEYTMYGDIYGGEVAGTWQVLPRWRLKAGYSYVHIELGQNTAVPRQAALDTRGGNAPEHMASLASQLAVRRDLDFDMTVRYVDRLWVLDVDSYVDVDTRLAWRVRPNVELSLIGRNLVANHQEFSDFEVERSVFGRVECYF